MNGFPRTRDLPPPAFLYTDVPPGAPTVYLAGPISGCSYEGCTDWREQVIRDLAQAGIKGLSPMRAKEYLKDITTPLTHPFPVGTKVMLRWGEGADDESGTIVEHGPRNVSYMVDTGTRTVHANQSVVEAVATDVGFSATCENYGHLSPLSGPRGIMTRDRFDATRCDVLFVNMLGATKVSVGTVMEIAWADLKRTPIVLCMEPGNIHEHAMLAEATGFRCGSIAEGLHVTKAILS